MFEAVLMAWTITMGRAAGLAHSQGRPHHFARPFCLSMRADGED